jgi:hypothetical protein
MVETLQKLAHWVTELSVPSKVLLSAALILSALFALSIIWSAPLKHGNSEPSQGSGDGSHATIRIEGKDIRVRDVFIQQGDSPKIKQQKITLAKRAIASEILSDIAAIDARLGYVEEAVKPDKFAEKLQEARRKTAPAAAEAAASGYRRLIAEANVGSLRQAFGSPLRENASQTVVQMLIEAGVQAKPIQYFYDQIKEVEWASESLLSALAESTKDKQGAESMWSDYYVKRITLAVQALRLRSNVAYLAGLKALKELNGDRPDANAELSSLKHLEIQDLSSPAVIERALKRDLAAMEELVAQKDALRETGQQLLQKEVEEFERLNEQLKINKTDTWSEVVSKAISLRELGRVPEAIAAFNRYKEMFSSIDSGAKSYADTAKVFTLQMKSLDLDGGIYVHQILDGGAAREANLKVGDIIIEYDGKPIVKMDSILAALNDSREGEANRLTYLRFHPETGRFTRHISVVRGGPLGAGFMPI